MLHHVGIYYVLDISENRSIAVQDTEYESRIVDTYSSGSKIGSS
jgi:hypothetical protein